MFLKEKRSGKIKGRGCAVGRKQRAWTNRYDSSSPTAYLESLFLTACVDAKENRLDCAVDVPGAFLQCDQDSDEIIHVRMRGATAHLLAKSTQTDITHSLFSSINVDNRLFTRSYKNVCMERYAPLYNSGNCWPI
jgi:hypothetical protein